MLIACASTPEPPAFPEAEADVEADAPVVLDAEDEPELEPHADSSSSAPDARTATDAPARSAVPRGVVGRRVVLVMSVVSSEEAAEGAGSRLARARRWWRAHD
ncbi:hypothetical protein [Streptomyces sp. CA-111067]|uniref:hypothetical protein n=1 Tax=Streptomyces sp. CA-111067 TaxID=3240046 RepID=UPI003D965583